MDSGGNGFLSSVLTSRVYDGRARLRPPVRRPAGDRRAGHDRRGDHPPEPRPGGRRVRAGRRRRPARGHRRVREGAPADARVRGRAERVGRALPVARGGPARAPRPRRHLRGRLGGRFNISLFHYRNHGADFGRVPAAFEVPPGDEPALQAFLVGLGYTWVEETANVAFELFLSGAGRAVSGST